MSSDGMAENVQLGSKKSGPSLEEGMYYERVFAPSKCRVIFNEIDGKLQLAKIVLEDENGQSLEVSDKRLVSRVLMYLAKYTSFGNVAALRELEPDVLQAALNGAIEKRDKDLKAMYNDQGKLCGIASTMHEQVSWAKIREIVESVIREATGEEVIQPSNYAHDFKWAYQVPVKNKNVSSWVGVHAGNNIIKGHSSIRIFGRFRTEMEEGQGGVKRPACLNWCGMWQFPEQFFKVDVKRLNNIVKIIGAENVKNFSLAQFHLKPDLEEFKKDVQSGISNMVEAMKKVTPVIDKSIHSALGRKEMEDILRAYQTKGNSYVPDYIVDMILKHVEDETVWGFSQAVSWVRTHGEYKFAASTHPMFKEREDRDLTWRLENIAGEVLSLTPTINDIHKKHGPITLEFLVGEEKAAEVREAEKQKLEKQTAKAVVVCSQ
jgi:hypothetical protein